MKSSVGQMGRKTVFNQNLLIALLVFLSVFFNGLSAKVKHIFWIILRKSHHFWDISNCCAMKILFKDLCKKTVKKADVFCKNMWIIHFPMCRVSTSFICEHFLCPCPIRYQNLVAIAKKNVDGYQRLARNDLFCCYMCQTIVHKNMIINKTGEILLWILFTLMPWLFGF